MSRKLAKKRYSLWLQNPRCCYCGVVTIFKPSHIKAIIFDGERDRLATIDHIRPRHHPERREPPKPGQVLLVLSCWRCNNERDKRELATKPKEWFEQQGGTKPLSKRSDEELELILSRLGKPYQVGRGTQAKTRFNRLKKSQSAVVWELFERGMDE